MPEKRPYEIIRDLSEQRLAYVDEEILAELATLPVLPDEEDSAWKSEEIYEKVFLYLALADQIRQRRLREGVSLLLKRASYGDPGEMMRGLRHTFEAAFSPDWAALADVCMEAAKYPERGARLWAVEELARLRDPRSMSILAEALTDTAKIVCMEAADGLRNLAVQHPEFQEQVHRLLERHINRYGQLMNHFIDNLSEVEVWFPTLEQYMGSSDFPVEVVQGRLVICYPPVRVQTKITQHLWHSIGTFVKEQKLGTSWVNAAFIPEIDDLKRLVAALMPDVSFVTKERITVHNQEHPDRDEPWWIAPDLAIEVVSRYDTYSYINQKVADYLRYGVRLTIIIDPKTKSIRVHTQDNPDGHTLHLDDTLSGDPVLPGWSMKVAEIFGENPTEE